MKQPIPLGILEQHLVALGKTGAGKSSMLRVLHEMILDAGKRLCIIDPKGDHYGLKLGADGKSPGYSVMAFGDFKNPKASNLSINDRSGREIGELVATGNRPCIIGFRGWMPSQMHRFWIDFAAALFNKNSSPLYLTIDEVHNFAPKGKILSPQVGECLHWANRLGSEGRGNGLRIQMASQRPQKVHNDLLTCAETLVAMRVTHPSDRKAVADWLKEYSTDNERGNLVLSSLSGMKRGETFVWSPEAEFFERLQFPLFTTFDSFAAPKEGKQAELKGWAEVDLDEVKERLASAIEEAKSKDPAELKKRIAELTREVQELQRPGKKSTENEVDTKALHVLRSTNSQLKKQLEQAMKILVEVTTRNFDASIPKEEIEKAVTAAVASGLRAVESILERRDKEIAGLKEKASHIISRIQEISKEDTTVKIDVKHNEPFTVKAAPAARPLKSTTSSFNGDIPRPRLAVLNALSWWKALGHDKPVREAVAFVAGMSPKSSHYSNSLSACRTAGLLDYPAQGLVSLTPEGEKVAVGPDYTPGGRELKEMVDKVLDGPGRKQFAVLWDNPEEMSREDLARAAGMSPSSSHFSNVLSRLRTLTLCEYPKQGSVKLASWVKEMQ